MENADFVRDEKIDLTNCDRKPIHIPGAIQPHGVLVVISEPEAIIRQISENVNENFGLVVGQLLGKPLGDLLEPDDLHFLRDNILTQNLEPNPARISRR